MKRLLSIALLAFAIFTVGFGRPALAGDAANGAKIFSANCAACHIGGGNVVMGMKTLKKEALEKYGMNSIEAITTQITKGKSAMPAFAGRLKPEQIEDVATYVLEQSAKDWKG
ncbi:c-type cytochrome [Microcoleus sp. N9_B2]|uniref:cytochrome c6 PetJ n=1 Tax=unclassified Microcoleus TaxID=2642155 RepID=UPI002FD09852